MVESADEVRTFMFTDIQGSTRLWEEHEGQMSSVLARHDQVIQDAVEANGGSVFKHMGDGVVASFPSPQRAVQAAIRAQIEFGQVDWGDVGQLKARMGIHMGPARKRGSDFFGRTVNRCARLMGCAHGGQVVISSVSAEELTRDGTDPWTLKDLGVHQLRDLSQPERVLQVCHPALAPSFPPLSTVDAVPRVLPRGAELFMGRDRELRELRDLVKRSRLTTITGPGGVGKTQLALAGSNSALRDFPDGAWFLPVTGDLNGEELAGQLADLVGMGPIPDLSEVNRLAEGLGGKRALLIIDNAEDSLEATKAVVSEILQRCDRVSFIVTSRVLLKVRGEQAMAVGPLAVPSSEELNPTQARRAPAVRLFVERAQQASPNFELTADNVAHVVSICERVDGLPLAVELAASQMGTFDPEMLAARIGGRVSLIDDRDRTLAAIVDWSFGTLTTEQQRLFRRLAVFAGGFGLAAAEKICADAPGASADARAGESGLVEFDIMPLLNDLVQKSVIVVDHADGQTRYRMLALLREYAGERLNEADEKDAIRDAHLEYFLTLATEVQVGLRGPREAGWSTVMEAEFNNVRAAFDWAIESERLRQAQAMLSAAQRFGRQRLRYEMLSWAEDVIKLAEQSTSGEPDPGIVDALAIRAGAAAIAGDYAESLRLGAEASELDEQFGGGNPFEPYKSLVISLILSQKVERALEVVAAARAAAERLDRPDEGIEFQALSVLALTTAGRRDHAQREAASAVEAAREWRNPSLLAFCLYAAGSIEPDLDQALALLDEAVDFADRVGNRYVLANALQFATWRQAAPGADAESRLASAPTFAQVIQHWYRVGNWSSFEMSVRMCVEALAGTLHDEVALLFAGWLLRGDRSVDDMVGTTERFTEALEVLEAREGAAAVRRGIREGQMMDATDLVAMCRNRLAVIDIEPAPASNLPTESSARP